MIRYFEDFRDAQDICGFFMGGGMDGVTPAADETRECGWVLPAGSRETDYED